MRDLPRKRPADAPRFRSADVLRAARYCCPSGTFCGLRIKIWGFPPFSARPVSALQGFEDAVHCFLLRYPVCGGIGREAFLGEGRDAERDGHVAALYGLASGSFPCAPALFFACFFHNRFVFCIFALPAKREGRAAIPPLCWNQRAISNVTLIFQTLKTIFGLIF